MDARHYTCKILEAADEGIVEWQTLAQECLSYMSEADVADMNRVAEFVSDDEDEDEDEDA
jgi:hypothetical protein